MKNFTLDEANSYIPWLEEVFQKLFQMQEHILSRQDKMSETMRLGRRNGGSSISTEMQDAKGKIEEEQQSLRRLLEKVTAKGIVVRDITRGLIDFPHIRDGREVYLCWIRGEEVIRFWHDTDMGFAARQPL